MLKEFWSDIKNVENASAEDIQSDILTYLNMIEAAERQRDEAMEKVVTMQAEHTETIKSTVERLRDIQVNMKIMRENLDEAVKTLEKIKEDTSPGDWYYGGINYDVTEALKRIKGEVNAEGHQSTESAKAKPEAE